MACKMNIDQRMTLEKINDGWPETNIVTNEAPMEMEFHSVLSHHDCMEPDKSVRCHRTIRTNTPAGSQTQSFRIHPDGFIERKL